VNGKVITMTGSSGDTFVTTVAANGATSLVTTDAAAAAAHLTITADGTVDINSAGVLTLDSGAAINIEPASGSAILLDGTISIDAGVVTGATSITSTAFVGALTGNVAGNLTGTVATVTQNSITTMTGLTTSGALNAGSITSGFGAIDNGASNITTGGIISIDVDADANDNTGNSSTGRLAIGGSGDLNLYHNTNSYIVNQTGNLILHTETDDADIIFTGEDGSSGITALTLDMSAAGAATFNSTVTGTTFVGALTGNVAGNLTGTVATATQNSITTMTGLVTTGALNSGTITTGFGAIDVGTSTITTGGVIHIDQDADAEDDSGDSAAGRLTIGVGQDLNLYHGGTNSWIVNDTGLLNIQSAGGILINDAGADVDFRIESDSKTHQFFVDGGNERVGINDSTPQTDLSITALSTNGSAHTTGLQIRHNGYSGYKFGMSAGDTSATTHNCGFIGFQGGDHTGNGKRSIIFETRPGTTDAAPTKRMEIADSGQITMPTQPAFSATNSGAQNDIAVNTAANTNLAINTTHTLALATEVFDIGGNYGSNTFTAPVTGKYQLNAQVRTNSLDTDTDYYALELVTSNRTYTAILVASSFSSNAGYWTMNICILADMDINDTAILKFHVPNTGAAQVDIEQDTYFSGFLAC